MKAIGYLKQFREDKLKDKSENTVNAYISDIRQLEAFLGKDFEDMTWMILAPLKSI